MNNGNHHWWTNNHPQQSTDDLESETGGKSWCVIVVRQIPQVVVHWNNAYWSCFGNNYKQISGWLLCSANVVSWQTRSPNQQCVVGKHAWKRFEKDMPIGEEMDIKEKSKKFRTISNISLVFDSFVSIFFTCPVLFFLFVHNYQFLNR